MKGNRYHTNGISTDSRDQPSKRLKKTLGAMMATNSHNDDNALNWDNVWSVIDTFLKNGQYQEVADLLKKAQDQPAKSDHASEVLSAAERVCRLCSRYQTEVQRFREAAQHADRLETELRQQLQLMLAPADNKPLPRRTPARQTRSAFKIYCFGRFQLFYDDQAISDWNSLKARSIFKYLVAHNGRPVSKETLMDRFWPDAGFEAARRNLHQAIYCLRHTLRRAETVESPILFENDCYLLNPALNIWIDFVEFKARIEAGRVLEQDGRPKEAVAVYELAEKLYAGDFLADDLFEEWAYIQREHLRSNYLEVTSRLSDYYLAQQDYPKLIHLGQKVLRQDRCYEDAHRWLMWGYLARGQRQLAVRQFLQCVEALKAELDVPPAPETEALYRQIAEGNDGLLLAGLQTFAL